MLCIQKPIRADDFVTAQKKREILTGDFAALLVGCAVAARVITRGHRDAVYFLPVSLLRSFIYIGLTTWWGISLWQRIVQAQVRRYLAATAALCVFWLSIRTVKFFFAATPAAIRYLWYKNKKQIDNDRENWVVFQDVHEAIIERAMYEQVQQKRGKIRKRRTNNGEHNMFSGLLVCADCGSNLHFHFNQGNPEIKYFNCSNYKGNRGTCTSTHYVRVDFLEEVVLGEIRRLTKFASLYEDEFVKAVIGHSQQAEQTDRKLKEKELRTLLARDEELDGLFERIYEDNVSGKLSDDRFAKMSRRYEDEQKELSEKIKKLRSEIEKQSSRSMTTDMFIGLVRKYTRARKLIYREFLQGKSTNAIATMLTEEGIPTPGKKPCGSGPPWRAFSGTRSTKALRCCKNPSRWIFLPRKQKSTREKCHNIM